MGSAVVVSVRTEPEMAFEWPSSRLTKTKTFLKSSEHFSVSYLMSSGLVFDWSVVTMSLRWPPSGNTGIKIFGNFFRAPEEGLSPAVTTRKSS